MISSPKQNANLYNKNLRTFTENFKKENGITEEKYFVWPCCEPWIQRKMEQYDMCDSPMTLYDVCACYFPLTQCAGRGCEPCSQRKVEQCPLARTVTAMHR